MIVTNGVVKARFNEEVEIVHKFTNTMPEVGNLSANSPIEMIETGLVFSDNDDMFIPSVVLATCTDEAAPAMVNGTIIGANHGMPCAITILSENHNKTVKDVGAIYKDEQGVLFYLVKVLDDSRLVFVSEDKSQSECSYDFTLKITGNLTYVKNGKNTNLIVVENQQRGYLCRTNRYIKKDVLSCTNGKLEKAISSKGGCDYGVFSEEYLIIDPTSCVKELSEKRPKNGYSGIIDISNFGEPILKFKNDYIIQNDGTILVVFDHKKIKNCKWYNQMGIMSQTKRDVYGGGVYRIIPKTKPLTDEKGTYDFTKQVPLYPLNSNALPKRIELTSEFWQDKNSPPDRVVEYFKDEKGNDRLCYACGYLPLYDCEPNVRAKNTTSAFTVVASRKVYPVVKNGDIDSCKGVGYKKYFEPVENGISIYSINYENKNYIYADFCKSGKCEYEVKGKVTLFEKSSDISYEVIGNKLIINCLKDGTFNFATFIEELW